MTVREWTAQAESRLGSFAAPRLEAQLLAAHALGISRTSLLAHPNESFPELAGESLLQRRERHEPLAYILGRREFYGRDFAVRTGVLVPRQETEILVETCLALTLPETARVVDVGTGSGCIGITLALERPRWRVEGIDISPRALQIARDNAEALDAEFPLSRSDLLSEIEGSFDLVVSNPPYIGRDEVIPEEVRGWEPDEALFAEETGLAIYRRLSLEAPHHLLVGGWLAVEVGHKQARTVADLLLNGGWTNIEIDADLSGVPRVVRARRP